MRVARFVVVEIYGWGGGRHIHSGGSDNSVIVVFVAKGKNSKAKVNKTIPRLGSMLFQHINKYSQFKYTRRL